MLLLSPQIPLLFMGEEWGETNPFGFFTDFDGELAKAVREGRRREFAKWPHFASEEHSALIADPNAESTFEESRLDWRKIASSQAPRAASIRAAPCWTCAGARSCRLSPRIGGNAGSFEMFGESAFQVSVAARRRRRAAALRQSRRGRSVRSAERRRGRVIYAHGEDAEAAFLAGSLPPRAVVSMIEDERRLRAASDMSEALDRLAAMAGIEAELHRAHRRDRHRQRGGEAGDARTPWASPPATMRRSRRAWPH